MNIQMPSKTMRIFLSLLGLSLLASSPAWAHFIWIETPTVVKTGGNLPLQVYFGEYHEGLREKHGGRLDERNGLELRAVSPSGKMSGPISWSAGENRFSGNIPLDEPGIYDLIGTDAKSAVVDYTKYGIGVVRPMFYTRTRILSFREGTVSKGVREPEPQMDLDVLPVTRHLDIRSGEFGPAPKEEVMYRVFFKGKPLTEKADIFIGAPNGWLWEGKLDKEGTGRFTPLWPGLYIIDVVFKEKSSGTFEGKSYEAVRHRATLSLRVHPHAADQ